MAGRWQPRHVVALTALVVVGLVLAPVGVKAAGQLVNIADRSDDALVAQVDRWGRLKVDADAARPFQTVKRLANFHSAGTQLIIGPTTARLSISNIQQANYPENADAWGTYVWQVPGSTASECFSNLTASSRRRVLDTVIPPSSTVSTHFDGGVVLRGTSAAPSWCLIGNAAPATSVVAGNAATVSMSISGTIVAGNYVPLELGEPAPRPTPGTGNPAEPPQH